MNKIDLTTITVSEASAKMKSGEITSVALTEAYLAQIEKSNKDINAYLEVFDDAIVSAKASDKRRAAGKVGALEGIPCAIKDNILIKGKIASSASKILEDYRATYDATAVSKLKDAGAIFLGRTNMDEFAMGGSTENSAFGVTRNPYDLERVAGGSSGGSAAAVAMNGALFALGSDTGGSVRQPSSFCGVVGLKPTYGAVSRYGVMAMGSSLDQIGPITKTVIDNELIFKTISGKDDKDGTTLSSEKTGIHTNRKPVIGIPRHFLGEGIKKDVLDNFDASIKRLENMGYKTVEIELPNISYSLMVYYIVMPAEVSSNMARFDGVKYGLHVDGANIIDDYFKTRRAGFGREVIRRILLGTYVLSSGYYDAYYNRANAVRKMITDDFVKAFETVDIIATPTAPSPAFRIGEKNNDPVSMYLEDIFTVTANLTGLPAISLPSGFAKAGDKDLPLGLQFIGKFGEEGTIFDVGKSFMGEV